MSNIKAELPWGSKHIGWESQFMRVSRYLKRHLEADEPNDIQDFLFAFYQNAHHLRDWSPGGKTQAEIDSFLNSNLATRVCRDVANMTKHENLTRKPAQTSQPCLGRAFAGENRGWFEKDSVLSIITNNNGKGVVLDARNVARECLRLWCEFMPQNTMVKKIILDFEFTNRPIEIEIKMSDYI